MTVSDAKNSAMEAALNKDGATSDLELEFWTKMLAGEIGGGAGSVGPRGPVGPVGPEGPKGEKGEKGDKGEVTLQDIADAENRGIATGTGSVKSLGNGWWYVPADSTLTGRPKGSIGDIAIYKTEVRPSGTVLEAFGMDKDGPQKWEQFKTATSNGYTPWIKLSVTDILTVAQVEKYLTDKGWGPIPGGTVKPTPAVPKIYATFSTSFPSTLSEMTSSDAPTITISRTNSDAERIFVAVKEDVGRKVSGIKVGTGLAASWQYRDMNIEGEPYRVFYSDGGYYTKQETITVGSIV